MLQLPTNSRVHWQKCISRWIWIAAEWRWSHHLSLPFNCHSLSLWIVIVFATTRSNYQRHKQIATPNIGRVFYLLPPFPDPPPIDWLHLIKLSIKLISRWHLSKVLSILSKHLPVLKGIRLTMSRLHPSLFIESPRSSIPSSPSQSVSSNTFLLAHSQQTGRRHISTATRLWPNIDLSDCGHHQGLFVFRSWRLANGWKYVPGEILPSTMSK